MTVPIMPVSSYTKITRPWRIVLIDPSTRMEILIPAFKFLEVAVTVVSLFNDVKTSILFFLIYLFPTFFLVYLKHIRKGINEESLGGAWPPFD